MPHSTIDTADRGDSVNRYGPSAGRARPTGVRRLATPTVDIHAHVAVPEAAAYIAPHLVMTDIAMVRHSNLETRQINMTQDADRKVAMVDMDDRLAVLEGRSRLPATLFGFPEAVDDRAVRLTSFWVSSLTQGDPC